MGPLELYLQERPLSVDGVIITGKKPGEVFSDENRISGVLWLNRQEGAIEFQTNDDRNLMNTEIYCDKAPDFTDLSFTVAQLSAKSSNSLHYITLLTLYKILTQSRSLGGVVFLQLSPTHRARSQESLSQRQQSLVMSKLEKGSRWTLNRPGPG